MVNIRLSFNGWYILLGTKGTLVLCMVQSKLTTFVPPQTPILWALRGFFCLWYIWYIKNRHIIIINIYTNTIYLSIYFLLYIYKKNVPNVPKAYKPHNIGVYTRYIF